MAAQEQQVHVYENWSGTEPLRLGALYTNFIRGQESFAFSYDRTWLSDHAASAMLDPDLELYEGRQYTPLDKAQFGLFADSCPDRWGRLLMNRKEMQIARKEARKPRKLTQTDYLLGVYDASRMGALRFRKDEDGPFLSADTALATPPWVSLRELQNASARFERDQDDADEKWLDLLLAPGSSLGGARPKATVQAPDDSLWIAKFPSKHDDNNTGAWEKVVHDLAGLCGICIPESKLETFSKQGSTFLVKRFDRQGKRRIHFASAMTLLGKQDGASGKDGSSYLDLASFIRAYGAHPQEDLRELWMRIVFSMAVSNTDDHLRNHGFLLTDAGWTLSPMYDVNPNYDGENLSLNVSEFDSTISIPLAIEVCGYFGIERAKADKMAADICAAVKKNWQRLAGIYGISRKEMERMRPAFRECE